MQTLITRPRRALIGFCADDRSHRNWYPTYHLPFVFFQLDSVSFLRVVLRFTLLYSSEVPLLRILIDGDLFGP